MRRRAYTRQLTWENYVKLKSKDVKTNKKELNDLISQLEVLSGYDKDSAKHLNVDFAACYGGYRLVLVDNETGGQYGCFGQSSCAARMNIKEFYYYLTGLISGIRHEMNN